MASFSRAFVTGASSGIGRALAEHLASGGARVVVAARRRAELESLRDTIAARGGRADICVLDVSDTSATHEAVRRWDRDTGGLDLVVANAGIDLRSGSGLPEWTDVERVLEVNTLGALATLLAAVEPMTERKRGTLAAISSLAAIRGLPGHAAYSASKAAVSTYLEALRVELAPRNVRVVDVRPGFVDTPMTRKNRFVQPFKMDVDEAARITVRGLERGEAVVTYPWQLSLAMRAAGVLPDALWRVLAARLPR